MNRRGFLSLLGIGAATAAVDPERLLWVPGRKLISIPKPSGNRFLTRQEITSAQLEILLRNRVDILGPFKVIHLGKFEVWS
jgi:hypothetical protein